MKRFLSIVMAAMLGLSLLSTAAMADAKHGQKFYLKKLSGKCRKDGIKNGGIFAKKHTRSQWDKLKEKGLLKKEWKSICPHAAKKIKKMKKKDVKNLFDFVWKYAKDGEEPSCG